MLSAPLLAALCLLCVSAQDVPSCLCQNGGTCVGHKCKCPPGFLGLKCEKVCPCQNGGKCVGKNPRCKCPPQVYGECCEFKSPCQNGGRCVGVKPREGAQCQEASLGLKHCPHFDFKCKCKAGWTGPLCAQSSCRCENGGTCVLGKFCICPPMFVGKRCETKITCCIVWGDPHLLTFDGARMDFQGACRYNMASLCPCIVAPQGAPSFSVHMKNWRRAKNTKVSWLRSLDVYIGGTRVTLGEKHAVLVNGVLATLPTKKVRDTTISLDGKNVRIDTKFGASVSFDGNSKAIVCVPETWQGKLCGICGNYDGNRVNDYVTKHGDKLEHVATYKERAPHVAQSWRVADRMRETCVEEPLTGTKAPVSEAWKNMAASNEYCGLIKDPKGPFATCVSKLSKEKVSEYLFACTFDVMEMTPDKAEAKRMACNSLEAFADECAEINSRADRKWRQLTGCQYQCPEGMVYQEKMSPCLATCADPNAPNTCTKVETDGCICAEGTLLSGGKCIKKEKCGCTDKGNYYQMHETYYSDHCVDKYTCVPGNVTSASHIEKHPGCTEMETCMAIDGVQKCMPTPVAGDWGVWSAWSSCSAVPGEEGIVQMRTRTCDNPPPQNGGTCIGNPREIRQCLPGDV